jgi:hypothetical protein
VVVESAEERQCPVEQLRRFVRDLATQCSSISTNRLRAWPPVVVGAGERPRGFCQHVEDLVHNRTADTFSCYQGARHRGAVNVTDLAVAPETTAA